MSIFSKHIEETAHPGLKARMLVQRLGADVKEQQAVDWVDDSEERYLALEAMYITLWDIDDHIITDGTDAAAVLNKLMELIEGQPRPYALRA